MLKYGTYLKKCKYFQSISNKSNVRYVCMYRYLKYDKKNEKIKYLDMFMNIQENISVARIDACDLTQLPAFKFKLSQVQVLQQQL
jgi:hypothetical protein